MVLGIIPARFASTRFPGKPLVEIKGKTMVQCVYEQVQRASRIDHVVVATDDARIYDHVRSFGGNVRMTSAAHPSGTDRCAEVAQDFPDATIVVNIQGDEPFIQAEQINLLTETLSQQSDCSVATLAKKINDPAILNDPNIVKMVFGKSGALYFSRQAIPFVRNKKPGEWLKSHDFYKHIGMYAYRRDTLLQLAGLSPSPLEMAESLEQLRWLENGFRIAVGITELETIGIDTPEDLLKVTGG
ncbi:MAG: 3-deoxy-manno-octulosonate cytidylyltransferase [Bacteroidetes bacterium]|nr:MAG: 3-deoxy-manno-octulosonate cytidylyltransferase [Bacteroidota bacterium]